MHSKEFSGNQWKHQNSDPFILPYKFRLIFMGMKPFVFFLIQNGLFFKNRKKNVMKAFLACFWAYVRQPHSHIRWATSIPFTSINPIHPRTNLWNFREKTLRISFFEAAILICFPWFPVNSLLCLILRYTV